MVDGFDINMITGKANKIATEVDNNNVKDGKLSKHEMSIFLSQCEENGINTKEEPWYLQCVDFSTKYNNEINHKLQAEMDAQTQKIGVRDATYVAPPSIVAFEKQEEVSQTNPENSENPEQIAEVPQPNNLGEKSDIRTNYEWSENEFAKVLDQMLNAPRYNGKFKNSVLQGKAKAFIESGKKFNIDPRILVAISMCESARGISEKAQKLNNVGGLRSGTQYIHFDTVEESIDSIARTVNTRYQEGFKTPFEIAHSGRYCAKHAAANWLSNLNSYLGFFNKYYEKNEI